MARVGVHLATGFEELEAITVLDVLRRADIEVLMISMTKEENVTSARGLTVVSDILFKDVNYEKIDMIVLPGGIPGSTNLAAHEGLKQKIDQFANQGKYLASICAAPIVYGQMGLLKGKTAVCYPGYEKYLNGAEITTERVVQTQNYITSIGPGASLEFSFKLVEILKDKNISEKVRKAMLA
mgnify:CR=1 FL=1